MFLFMVQPLPPQPEKIYKKIVLANGNTLYEKGEMKKWFSFCCFVVFFSPALTALCPNNIGYSIIGGLTPGAATGQCKADAVTIGSTSGNIDSVQVYVSTAAGNMQCALYNNNAGQPGTAIAISASIAVGVGWNIFPITSTQVTANTVYYFAYEMNNASNVTNFDSSGSQLRLSINVSYGTFPTNGTWTTAAVVDSIYGTICYGGPQFPPGFL